MCFFYSNYPCMAEKSEASWTETTKYNPNDTLECSCETGIQKCPEGLSFVAVCHYIWEI